MLRAPMYTNKYLKNQVAWTETYGNFTKQNINEVTFSGVKKMNLDKLNGCVNYLRDRRKSRKSFLKAIAREAVVNGLTYNVFKLSDSVKIGHSVNFIILKRFGPSNV